MLAWQEDGGSSGGAEAGGGGFGPEVEVAPVSWDAGGEAGAGDDGDDGDDGNGGGVAKVELTLSAGV
eukprot:scaffold90195_cov45-Phaeocystis_antarctica.AAC.1